MKMCCKCHLLKADYEFNYKYAKHCGMYDVCQACVTKEINRRKQMAKVLKIVNSLIN